jgi:hypothetical protein
VIRPLEAEPTFFNIVDPHELLEGIAAAMTVEKAGGMAAVVVIEIVRAHGVLEGKGRGGTVVLLCSMKGVLSPIVNSEEPLNNSVQND